MSKKKNKPQAAKQEPKTAPAPKAEPAKAAKAPHKNTNPMAIKWPTDPWGFTRELRTAVVKASTRCAGSAEKKELLDATLAVAVEFLDASHEKKAEKKAVLMEKARSEHVPTPPIAKAKKPEPEAEPELELEDEIEDVAEEESEEDAPELEGDALEDALFGDEDELDESDKE